jgi:hypothetical protein
LRFFLRKRKKRGLNTKRPHKNFLEIISLYKSLEKVLWKRQSEGRVAQGSEGLILGSSGKERLIGKKR